MRSGREAAPVLPLSVLLLLLLLPVLLCAVTSVAGTGACDRLQAVFRYPCTCSELGGGLALNCDGVVYATEYAGPPLTDDAPDVLVFTHRDAGHRSVPAYLFPTAVKLDLSQNSIRKLSEKSFVAVQNTIEDLRLAGNLLGDTLNPIFSTTEFHGLSKLVRLDLSDNQISSLEEGILKGCANLEELKLDDNRLESVPSSSLNGPESLRTLSLKNNRIDGVQQGAFLSQKRLAALDVSSNRVNNIEIGAFEGLSALRHLSLSGNRLSKFNSDVFDGAEKLEKLDVSNNFIGEFPSVALKKFDNLKTLNLSSNLIQKLDSAQLASLEVLDVSRNNIGNIPPGTFAGLKKLKVLDLAVNMLRTVEDDAFEGLSDLESLSLEDNNVLLIPATALGKLPRLNRLRLDYNRIAALSASILHGLADTLTELGLSRNVIREIPPDVFQDFKMLSVLDLSGNQLLTVEPSTFSGLADTLEHLNLHGNRIATLPSEPIDLHALETLDLSYNQLKEIPRHTFAAMSALTALNLSHNHHLALIPVTVFHPLTRLQTLDISSTGIKVLSAELFLRTTALVRLYARNNGIAELPDTAFHSLSNLVSLDLSDNLIGNVRIGSFAGLTSVRRVDLARNKLTSFKGEYFVTKRSDGTAVEELDLSGNQISYLFPSTFKVHPGVRTVDLSDNKFSTFPAELLAGLSRLRHVDLSGNSLTAVGEFGFAGLPRLRRLSLARNRIDAISETAFHNSTQLQYVDLAGNRLDRIGERTFQGLGRLRYLGLDDNALTELPDTVFDRSRLRTLEHVNLAGNAFATAPLRSLHAQHASLAAVDMSRNRLTELAEPGDAAAAATLVNVERLDVSFNRLSATAVRRLLTEPKTVRDLNMAGTGVTAVPALETPFLRKLNLSHNEIDAVDERAFDRATLLEELDVSGNRLRSLAPFRPVWPKLGRLQTLDVSRNPIAGIVHGDWDGLGSLRRLRAHHLPECDRIERSAFRPLTDLVELTVYGLPKLGYMDVAGLLGRLQSLETLDVEVKDATVGGQLSAAMSPRLESLTVRGHRVAHISSGALAGLKCRNVRVRISETSVTALPASLLVPLPRSSAVRLDVAGNQLATLTSQFLAALDDRRGLVRLDGLRSNPVRCDCNARALRRSPLAVDLVCAAPGFVAGSLLIEIPDDDLTCDATRQTTTTTTTTTTTSVAITAVTAAAAAAAVGKSPRTTTAEPDIIWSLPPATASSGAAHHQPGPPGPPRMTGNNGKQPNPALTATATNDDTLIIGIVAGVVVFIAILVVIICIVRIRLSTAEYNSHLNALPPVLGSGAVPAYCHGPAAYPMRMQTAAAHSYANSYATLPAHKLSSVSSSSPPYAAHNPYYVHPFGGAADEKDYAAAATMIMR